MGGGAACNYPLSKREFDITKTCYIELALFIGFLLFSRTTSDDKVEELRIVEELELIHD
jgi:hypothetical protein